MSGISLILVIALLLLLLAYLLFISNKMLLKVSPEVIKLMRESNELSRQIGIWLKENLKDGCSVSVLNDPELLALFKKDQELYDRIIKIDPGWGNGQMPPCELHKHFVELAQGKYKQTH